MFHERSDAGPRRIRRRFPNYVPNEVVVTTKPAARNDEVPHYLSVASGRAAPVPSYGDNSIDGVLHRVGTVVRSVSRVYVPRAAARELGSGAGPTALPAISASYEASEDDAGLSRTYRVTFGEAVQVPRVAEDLKSSTAVEDARPNYISEACAIPGDEFYGYQWGPSVIGCEEGWDLETGHGEAVVAIVDSGVDLNHEDLSEKLLPGHDFVDYPSGPDWRYTPLGDYQVRDDTPEDEDGHGSHCAGIAAAASNNDLGVAGVCWGGKILPVRVMFRVYDSLSARETSVGLATDISAGIKWAVDQGAQVVNLSLGGYQSSYEDIVDYAHDHNVCVLAATGNDGTTDAHYPAACANALAVGAIDSNLNRAGFSNYGSPYGAFVVAPGVEIASTYKDNSYVYLQGTSMAAPFVTGLAALIVSTGLRAGKTLAVDDVYELVRTSATPLGTGKGDPFFGEGLINVSAALAAARAQADC